MMSGLPGTPATSATRPANIAGPTCRHSRPVRARPLDPLVPWLHGVGAVTTTIRSNAAAVRMAANLEEGACRHQVFLFIGSLVAQRAGSSIDPSPARDRGYGAITDSD